MQIFSKGGEGQTKEGDAAAKTASGRAREPKYLDDDFDVLKIAEIACSALKISRRGHKSPLHEILLIYIPTLLDQVLFHNK